MSSDDTSRLVNRRPARHRKILRDHMKGVTKPALRRLARRGGVKRISGLIYQDVQSTLRLFLEQIVRDAVTYTEHARRKTVTENDVLYSLKRNGYSLYSGLSMNRECKVQKKSKAKKAVEIQSVSTRPDVKQVELLDGISKTIREMKLIESDIKMKYEQLFRDAKELFSSRNTGDLSNHVTVVDLESVFRLVSKIWFDESLSAWIVGYGCSIKFELSPLKDNDMAQIHRKSNFDRASKMTPKGEPGLFITENSEEYTIKFDVKYMDSKSQLYLDLQSKAVSKEYACSDVIECLCINMIHEISHLIQHVFYKDRTGDHNSQWKKIVKNIFGFINPETDPAESM